MKGWKNFDFGASFKKDENEEQKQTQIAPPEKPKPVKAKNVVSKTIKTFNFESEISPKKVEDLAVHPKKLKDVETWLQTTVLTQNNKQTASFLLITGPTGCGKTATVNVLCKSLNINVSEWVNPIDQDFEICRGPNQVNKFIEFLSETKYASLFDDSGGKKIALVKDFPNAVIHNPDEFFRVLEACYYQCKCPVVFISTEAGSNNVNLSHNLFPDEIKLKYQIAEIQFNACATTILKNALKRAASILQSKPELFKPVPAQTIEAILASCMGDIRSGVNQLYLASVIGCSELPTELDKKGKSTGTKRKRTDKSTKVKNMLKDETLGFFHGLGRVLNPKRIEVNGQQKVNCDFEKLIEEFSTLPGIFTSFLFENYIQYFGDINDISEAAQILSTSQIFLDKWHDRHETLVFALWVSVMGLMIHNQHRVSKWTQIKGPTKVNKCNLRKELRGLSPTDCYYHNLINKSEKYHMFNCEE